MSRGANPPTRTALHHYPGLNSGPVFEANEDYWDGAPQVKNLTVVHVPDGNARAQRLVAVEADGANLPPRRPGPSPIGQVSRSLRTPPPTGAG